MLTLLLFIHKIYRNLSDHKRWTGREKIIHIIHNKFYI
jgi:hypothetical protein